MAESPETLYRDGVARWRERDLPGAVESLSLVLASDGPDAGEGWWHSASRALAQIALEADNTSAADRNLLRLQGTGVGDAQTQALRSRSRFQEGDDEAALAECHIGVSRLATDHSSDVGSLMNGAIALIWCAEVIVEMGLGDDASALVNRARARIAEAGVEDRVITAMLHFIEASTSRLAGNFEAARSSLDAIDTSLSKDLLIQVTRELARIAVNTGQEDLAAGLYQRCLELARESDYVFLERSITEELETGPPAMRTGRAPVGQWDPRAMEVALEEHRPYALVITLPVRDDVEIQQFERRVSQMLRGRTALGYVDGTGSDGRSWEIFLDGDDPDLLWDAVRPLLGSPPLWRYAEITVREGSGSRRFRLGRPPS